MDSDIVIRTEGLRKVYHMGEVEVKALGSISLEIRKGEFTAIAGPSGSGKTTFLNFISGLDKPTSGSVYLGGKPIEDMSGRELSRFRRDHVGFIFQSYNLIPVLNVEENIEYVMLLQHVSADERKQRVHNILTDVGLEDKNKSMPSQLSGGQQQRVAIARAMVTNPDIILADEPTANLDSHTGSALLDLMKKLNEDKNMTFLFSTHDKMIMEKSNRLIVFKDGNMEQDNVKKAVTTNTNTNNENENIQQ
jgi:putative ABC transport system ATP-binding protein